MKVYNAKSKTHNFGMLLAVFGGIQMYLPEIEQYIPPESYGAIFAGVGFVVVVLRNVTKVPIDQR